MNWDAIGAIGELIGSITVVITVVYLAVQIKLSSKAAISVSTNQSRTAVADVIGAITSNTDSVKTYADVQLVHICYGVYKNRQLYQPQVFPM